MSVGAGSIKRAATAKTAEKAADVKNTAVKTATAKDVPVKEAVKKPVAKKPAAKKPTTSKAVKNTVIAATNEQVLEVLGQKQYGLLDELPTYLL